MNKEKIINLLKQIENELKKEKIELEEKNFKINSDNWTKKTDKDWEEYLENETADVWQLLSNGEQLFTWDAAIRETKKAGKRVPTDEEFEELNKEYFGEIIHTGYRSPNGSFYNLGDGAHFWSSSEIDNNAWNKFLFSSSFTVNRNINDKSYGFSIRCIKE